MSNIVIDLKLLQKACPFNKTNLTDWVEPLNIGLDNSSILDTKERAAAFLAQCAHESADFNRLEENLNYSDATLVKLFPKHFTPVEGVMYGRKPMAIGNKLYADRMGNGDEQSGDGYKYRGRGLIQLTGKNNYLLFQQASGELVLDNPDYLKTIPGAIASACHYWAVNKLNKFADAGNIDGLSIRINGGKIGLEERRAKYEHILSYLN